MLHVNPSGYTRYFKLTLTSNFGAEKLRSKLAVLFSVSSKSGDSNACMFHRDDVEFFQRETQKVRVGRKLIN